MKLKIFSVFDVKAGAYLPPFCFPQTPMAVRVFSDMCNSDESAFGLHPGDYTLFEVGVFDDAVCVLLPKAAAEKVVNGLEVVAGDEDRQLELVV